MKFNLNTPTANYCHCFSHCLRDKTFTCMHMYTAECGLSTLLLTGLLHQRKQVLCSKILLTTKPNSKPLLVSENPVFLHAGNK